MFWEYVSVEESSSVILFSHPLLRAGGTVPRTIDARYKSEVELGRWGSSTLLMEVMQVLTSCVWDQLLGPLFFHPSQNHLARTAFLHQMRVVSSPRGFVM